MHHQLQFHVAIIGHKRSYFCPITIYRYLALQKSVLSATSTVVRYNSRVNVLSQIFPLSITLSTPLTQTAGVGSYPLLSGTILMVLCSNACFALCRYLSTVCELIVLSCYQLSRVSIESSSVLLIKGLHRPVECVGVMCVEFGGW